MAISATLWAHVAWEGLYIYALCTFMMMMMMQLNLEREKELHKDDVAQLQFEVEQMTKKAADLQMKLVCSLCCRVTVTFFVSGLLCILHFYCAARCRCGRLK